VRGPWGGPLRSAVLLLIATVATAQIPARRLTTIDALRQFPGYFHLQNVLLHGEFAEAGRTIVLRAGDHSIPVVLNDARTTDGLVEVRGQLLDLGRMEPSDQRLLKIENLPPPDRWPRPGADLLFNITGIAPATLEVTPSVRALALQPWRFEGQTVTVVGQFRGRNLFGDLPAPPAASRNDFVLRSADAAIWVTGLQARGRGFNLDVDRRLDTGGWFQVTGTVASLRGLVTIAGMSMTPTEAPAVETRAEPVAPEAPAAPLEPVEVVFSSLTEGEIGVAPTTPLRVQFSKGLDPATLQGRFRITYAGDTTALEFAQSYDAANRAVEIKFARPLAALRTVRVELLEGLKAFDGSPVTPWTLTFSVGG
jgi:hypothetical protein